MLDSARYTNEKVLVVCTFVCVVFALVFCYADPAWASEFRVDSVTDAPDANPGDGTCSTASGDCTLRAAVQETNFSSYDTIMLPAGEYALGVEGKDEDDAATGDLDVVAGSLTIEGAGSGSTTIDGRGIDRVFDVRPDTWVTISGVTITGGDPGFAAGGGVRVRGQLELYDSSVTNNVAESGGGLDNSGGGGLYTDNTTIADNEAIDGHGGGVYNSGSQYDGYAGIERSTLSNNTASEFGGGIYSTGLAWLQNATLSGNTATEIGGGIRNFREYLSLENVTLADNSAPEGADLANDGGDTELWNTVVADGSGGGENCSGEPATSYGNNLDSGTSCRFGEPSDLTDTDPHLGELRDNGGPTATRAPSPDSPVVDAAQDGYCPRIDQRGAPRPGDGDGDGRAICDIGAYELGPPIAKDDAYEVDEDESLTVPAPGVLANDTDAEGDPLTAQLEGGADHGTLELREDGSFVYTPNKDFSGYDYFSYRADDGASGGDLATVTITVSGVADPPEAKDDSYWTDEDAKLTVPGWVANENGYQDYLPGVLNNDSDPDSASLTAKLVDGPKDGTLTFNQDGSFEYVPNTDSDGTDSFTYRANDGTADGNLATASIDVKPINDAPNAVADTATTDEDNSVNVNVLANDTDVEGNTLTVANFTQPRNGRVNCTPEGACTYTPNANFNGTDSFTYTVSDGVSGKTETVTVTINAVNDTPVAKDDAATTDENKAVNVATLANDSDADRDTLTVGSFTQGTNGVVNCTSAGTCTYKPKVGFNGVDSFTYTVSDGKGANGTAKVTVTVRSVDPPDTAITSGPSGAVSSASVSFAFSSTEPGSTFECSLDQAAFGGCTSPKSYAGLSDGPHVFKARATGASAEPDLTPASRSFTVDTAPPDTTIDSGPSGEVNAGSATFAFSSTESGSTFQCSLDGGAYSSCTSPKTYASLSEGSHTLRVKATDATGNADPTPAERTWAVDTVAPDTTITSGPSGLVNTKSASFGLSSSETGGRFECGLDGAPFASCASPVSYADLSDGAHTFAVRAVDGAGNVDSTPASRSWTVDATSPKVGSARPADGAKGVPVDANVEAVFSEDMAPASINGSTITLLKQGTTAPVAATVGYNGATRTATLDPSSPLPTDATYTATVKGGSAGVKDPAGNALAADVAWSFSTPDTRAPETAIDSGPSGTVSTPSVDFAFSSSEANATFECGLDGAAYSACSSPKTYAGLADGSHTFSVRAKDEAGNLDGTPASRSFAVDATAPAVNAPTENLDTSAALGATAVPVKIGWSATDPGSGVARYEVEQSTNGGAFAPVDPALPTDRTVSLSLEPANAYQFRVRALDGAGNWSAWRAGPSFRLYAPQETNGGVAYPSGTWTPASLSGFYGGSVKYESDAAARARFTFNGDQVAWVTTRAPIRGKAEVWIDGAKAATVDLYSATVEHRQMVFRKTGLDPSVSHALEVRVLGTKNASSTGTRVDVDAFVRIN